MDFADTGIYQILNTITGDTYIGQSARIKRRFAYHNSTLRRDCHDNTHLQRAWNKYGESAFVFKPLLYCETFELTRYEQGFVNVLAPAYNICKECVESALGVKRTEETRKRIGAAKKGVKPSEEARRKRSIAYRGDKNPNFGNHKPLSAETRKKISDSWKGKKHSDETRKKISVAIFEWWKQVHMENELKG